jgi:EF hand domain-containing protein
MRPRAFVAGLVIALPLVAAPVARAQNDDRAERRNSQSRETMQFQGMDRDHDGVITRREWRGSDASFRVHDWNGDNVLSGDEVRVGARRTPNNDEDYTPSPRPGFSDRTQAGFNRVDANRDGRVSRDEWQWSRRSFDRYDRNGDGVLSRAELASADTGNVAVGTSGSNETEVQVPSNQRWYDTGIDVRSGDIIDFRATGTIRMSTNGNDSASPSGAWNGRTADNAPFRDRPAGALIGHIGNGAPIFMGDNGRVNVATTGRLYLSVNDDFLQDNTGEYRVMISVRR